MVSAGIFGADDHIELIDGELIDVSPQGPTHIALKDHIRRLLEAVLDGAVHVREQGPLDLSPDSLLEPDLAIVRGMPRDYLNAHPTGRDALLVIEVAVTSQQHDRAKAAIYACAAVPEYWLVDVAGRCLAVYRQPLAQGQYGRVETLGDTDELAWSGTPHRWPVAAFLP